MKTVLITGGSRGIGKAMIELFCEKGYLVAFTYKNSAEAAKELYRKTGAFPIFADAEMEADIINAVKTAVDTGINFFDTADTYGLGESERTLSEALGADLYNAVITTKFGVRVENGKTFYDNSREYIFKAVEESLKRLNRDYIDLYQVHYRDGKTSLSDVAESLEILKQQGKIKYYGLSNIHKEDMEELRKFTVNPFVSFQDEYSLACRKNENDMFCFRDEFNMTPFTWGSLGQGILSGKYDKNCKFESNDRRSRDIYVNFHGEKLLKNLEKVIMPDVAFLTALSRKRSAVKVARKLVVTPA